MKIRVPLASVNETIHYCTLAQEEVRDVALGLRRFASLVRRIIL